MIAISDNYKLTPEEYLAAEAKSLIKHEYIDGEVYAMAGTTDSHNTIGLNLAFLIRSHLRGTECRIYFADIKAQIEAKNCFYYPDLLVTCDARDRETSSYKCFPKLIIEILSDSTEGFDRGDKFNDYQTLMSLEEYVLVSSKHQRVEIFHRQDHAWQYERYDLERSHIRLASLDLEIVIPDVYEDVTFETGDDRAV
jgi:Uma2 family endonuclease